MKKHNINPARLARVLTEDPDVLNETLYGHSVRRGHNDIDRLLVAIETGYIDWDIADSKFQSLFYKVFKATSGTDAIMIADVLIKTMQDQSSAQDQELIDKLIHLTEKQKAGQSVTSPIGTSSQSTSLGASNQNAYGPVSSQTYPTSGLITLANGSTFDAIVIIDGGRSPLLNDKLLWVGIKLSASRWNKPGHHYGKTGAQIKRAKALPELYRYVGRQRGSKYRTSICKKCSILHSFNASGCRMCGGVLTPKRSNSQFFKGYFDKLYHIVTINKQNVVSIR